MLYNHSIPAFATLTPSLCSAQKSLIFSLSVLRTIAITSNADAFALLSSKIPDFLAVRASHYRHIEI